MPQLDPEKRKEYNRKQYLKRKSSQNKETNITLSLEEISELEQLREKVFELEKENENLKMTLKHKDEIIDILKNIQYTVQPSTPPVVQEGDLKIISPPFNLEKYLESCKETETIDDVKNLMNENFDANDLISLTNCYESKTDVSKLYAKKITTFINKNYDLLPLRCSDLRRKTIYYKENDVWNKITFEEYTKITNKLHISVMNSLLVTINELHERHKKNQYDDCFTYNGVNFDSNKLLSVLYDEVNNEYIANQILESIKIQKCET